MSNIFRKAFEETYNRALAPVGVFPSFVSGFTGWKNKYKYKYPNKQGVFGSYNDEVVYIKSHNRYNNTEQFVFAIPRLIKNVAKLATEFFWNLLTESLVAAANYFDKNQFFGHELLATLCHGLSLIPWFVAKVGQSLTSPFAAMKSTYAYFAIDEITGFQKGWGSLFLAYFFAGLRGLFTVGAYAAIAVFTAPILAAPLAAYSWGHSLLLGLATATNWIASLPIISTIGAVFAGGMATVGSIFGINVVASFVSAAALAAAALVVTPVLAGLKVGLRYLSSQSQPDDIIPLNSEPYPPNTLTGYSSSAADKHQAVEKDEVNWSRRHLPNPPPQSAITSTSFSFDGSHKKYETAKQREENNFNHSSTRYRNSK